MDPRAVEHRRKMFTRQDAWPLAPHGTPEARMPGYLHPSARVAAYEEAQREAAAQERAAWEKSQRELLELRRDWEELNREIRAGQLEYKYPGQPRDDRGRYSFGKKPKGVQLAGDITGFTKHGINQTISRAISPASLHDAVVNPLQILPQANGTTQYVGRGAVVVLNPLGQVVTTWPK
jgi:hypothetical protein